MDPAQLERYSRHLLLPEIDFAGQQQLMNSSVLIVGAGGLGSPAAMYLAASGIGHLVLADHDHVDLGNLQRQLLHSTADIGRPKTESGRDRLLAINPEVRVETIAVRLDRETMTKKAAEVSVVLDATDNFETRFALNLACIAAGKPLVLGAAARLQGQLTVFDHRRDDSPCLTCLYPDEEDADTPDCVAGGV
ncbi:MAG: HesA/MoeB/ThiF family protein, partial [Chromatiales bacterium]|nr:HesA/MoeB/ThiF family protein [Chromatiales bacterium]